MTFLGTGKPIKLVDGILSPGPLGPLFPSQGSLWGHSESRPVYAAWTPQPIINTFFTLLWWWFLPEENVPEFQIQVPLVTSDVYEGGGGSTNVSVGFCIGCWRMSQLWYGPSFLMEFGRSGVKLLDLAYKSPGGKPPTTSVILVLHTLILQRLRSGSDGQEAPKPLNCRTSSYELKDHPWNWRHPHIMFASQLSWWWGCQALPLKERAFICLSKTAI